MSDLKNRERYSTSINKELLKQLKELSAATKIPATKLLDEAIEELLKKYSRNNK